MGLNRNVVLAETEAERAGADYLCADVAFGDIAFAEAARTVELLGEQVLPAFSGP